MDEMTQLRELRADAPTPDRARLAPGRTALLDAAGKRRSSGGVSWRRLSVVGAAAAMVVVVLTTAQLPGGGGGSAQPSASQDGQTPHGRDDAATVLRKAATAAADRPGLQPRTGQWVYVKILEGNRDAPMPLEAETREKWYEYGELRPNWKSDIHYTYREQCALFRALPADPDRVFREALKLLPEGAASGHTGAENFETAQFLLNTPAPPPEGLARLYRGLAEVEGVRVVEHLVEDATGDKAIALYYGEPEEIRTVILFDAQTYRYVGTRSVQLVDQKPFPDQPDIPLFDAGDVIGNKKVVETALVERKGQRP